MWRSKKFIAIAVVVAVVLVGSIGGIVSAQSDNGDDSPLGAQRGALLDRVCEIYEENTGVAINQQELKDAFAQTQSEMRDEALDRHLQKLVEQGKMSQDEANQYQEWRQAKPDIPLPRPFNCGSGFQGFPGGHRLPGWGAAHPAP